MDITAEGVQRQREPFETTALLAEGRRKATDAVSYYLSIRMLGRFGWAFAKYCIGPTLKVRNASERKGGGELIAWWDVVLGEGDKLRCDM